MKSTDHVFLFSELVSLWLSASQSVARQRVKIDRVLGVEGGQIKHGGMCSTVWCLPSRVKGSYVTHISFFFLFLLFTFFPMVLKKGVQTFVTFFTPDEFVSFHAQVSNGILVIDLQKVFCAS